MAVKYYEPRPFSHYYGNNPNFDWTVKSGNYCTRRGFWLWWPVTAYGVQFWNKIAGGPTMRVGLFNSNHVVLASGELTNCPEGLVQVTFSAPYEVTWTDIQTQNDLQYICFYTGIWDTSGTSYMETGTPLADLMYDNDSGMMGKSIFCSQYSAKTPGWDGTPTTCLRQAQDLIAVCSWSEDYDITPASYHQGLYARVPTLASPASAQTVGRKFYIKEPGATIYGVRFYTYDTNPWTAQCGLWSPYNAWYPTYGNPSTVLLRSATVNCIGRGIYDCLFEIPYTVLESDFIAMGDANKFTIGVFNQTNVNYSHGTYGQDYCFDGWNGGWNTNVIATAATPDNVYTIGASMTRPATSLYEGLPIDILIKEAT